MKLLPANERTLHQEHPNFVIVGAHEHPENTVCYTRFALSDLPNNLVSLDDLERIGVSVALIDGASVYERKAVRPFEVAVPGR